MSTKKIVVFPGSGFQGRAVCEALSKEPEYKVVAIVRNLEGAKLSGGGIALRDLPRVEIVQGEFGDPEGYRKHLEGAYGVYINTDYWSILPEVKYDQAAARATEIKYATDLFEELKKVDSLKHMIFSSLFVGAKETPPDSYILTSQQMERILEKTSLPWTIVYCTGYWDNLELFNLLQPQEDGTVKANYFCPDETSQAFTSIDVIGLYVKAILADPKRFLGQRVLNKSEWASWGSMATRLSGMGGKEVVTPAYTNEQWNSEAVKSAMGPFWGIMDSLYTGSIPFDIPGFTGKDVIGDAVPTFDIWAKRNEYIKKTVEI